MFDPRAAKALKPGEHLTVLEAPGLRLTATQTRRTWAYRFKSPVDGRMRQVKLGHWPAMGLPAALAAWERAKQQRDTGTDLAMQKRQKSAAAVRSRVSSGYLVSDARADFLGAYEGTVAPKTYAEAKRLLERELTPLEGRPCSSITRADAFDLLDGMRDRPVVAQQLRQLLGAVWDRAHDSGRLAEDVPNWWRLVLRGKLRSRGKVVKGKHQGVAKRALSELELRALLPWLPNFTRDVEDALTLILWTGCRGAEVVALERSEVTEEADGWWWTIPKAKLKMRRNPMLTDLRVPLEGRAAALVRRRLETPRWLFASRGRTGHLEQKALGVAVWAHRPDCNSRPEQIRPRLPVADFAPHDLRRTARTMLAALGCPTEVAELILGHMLPGMQAIYDLHSYDAERRLWLRRLAVRLEELSAAGAAGR